MIVRLLGTGAAEGIPAFYSDSRVSAYAREHGGREIRTRASALIDGHLKIDLPPDTLMQLQRDGLSAREWSALIFTHSHDDHFAYPELQYCLWPFNDFEYVDFTVYGNATIVAQLRESYPEWPIEVVETRSFQPFDHAGALVTPLHANHDDDEDSQNLLIEAGGKSVLYATDTGIWRPDTWDYLRGRRIDGLFLECTKGVVQDEYVGHLAVADFVAVVERLRAQETVHAGTVVVSTHHSHNGDATYAELEEALARHGFIAGYDGIEIDV